MKKTALCYGITVLVGLALTFFAALVQGVFGQTENAALMKIFCNAFFAAGAILACAGLLVVATEGGAFDMLSFAVVLIFDLFRKDVNKRKYKDFYEYRQAKKEKKRSFAFLLIVGVIFIAISLIFLIPYYN